MNPDGSISVNAEDTAIGFGWTQEKGGKLYIKWERINGFCKEIGFSPLVGKDDYIPESLFYRLGMKASNAIADKFQNWLAFEVIPAIRKTGSYTLEEEVDRLPAINKAAETILPILEELGMKPIHKAYMLKQLYRQAGVEIPIEGQEEDQHLYDSTQIAKKLGICSVKGLPHSQAVGAILKKLQLAEDEKVITSFERKGHVGTMCQYKESVVNAVARWLLENGHPETISYQDGKGREKTCTVIYQNIA